MSDIGGLTKKLEEDVNKADVWVNGPAGASYTTKDGEKVPTIRTLSEKAEINVDEAKMYAIEARAQVEKVQGIIDAAQLSGGVYKTKDEGVHATINGDYFSVVSDIASEFIDLYKNDNGNAEYIKTYPSSELIVKYVNNYGYSITDVFVDSPNKNISNNRITGKYVNANSGKEGIITNDSVGEIVCFPVAEGEFYLVTLNDGYLFDYARSIFSVYSEKVTESSYLLKSLTGRMETYKTIFPSKLLIKIPVGIGARFLATNTKLKNWDKSNIIDIQQYPSHLVRLKEFDELKLEHNSTLISSSDVVAEAFINEEEKGENLFASSNLLNGKYVIRMGEPTAAGISHQININSSTSCAIFNVEEGDEYLLYFNTNNPTVSNAIGLYGNNLDDIKNLNKIIYPTVVVAPVLTKSNNRVYLSIKIPEGFQVKYLVTNTKVNAFNIEETLEVYKVNGKLSKFIKKINDLDIIADNKYLFLNNKKWVAIGDSITEKNFRANKNYHDFIKEGADNLEIFNYGISGTGYYDRYNVAETITENPDIISIFWGTNDWGNVKTNNKPLGDFLDVGTDTISGCINTCLNGLINKFYKAKIAIITPLPRYGNWGGDAKNNKQGYTLKELSDLIIKYANHYSVPVLDLYSQSNLPVYIEAGNKFYFTAPNLNSPDGLHPNDAGHEVISNKIGAFLNDL